MELSYQKSEHSDALLIFEHHHEEYEAGREELPSMVIAEMDQTHKAEHYARLFVAAPALLDAAKCFWQSSKTPRSGSGPKK